MLMDELDDLHHHLLSPHDDDDDLTRYDSQHCMSSESDAWLTCLLSGSTMRSNDGGAFPASLPTGQDGLDLGSLQQDGRPQFE
jgi:hypothetical protein